MPKRKRAAAEAPDTKRPSKLQIALPAAVLPAAPKSEEEEEDAAPARKPARTEAEESVEAMVAFRKPVKTQSQKIAEFFAALNNIGMGKEAGQFIQNLGMLLNAGLPLTDGLKTIQLETRSRPMKKCITRVVEAVEAGTPLWTAMDEQRLFSPYAIALVRIGEEAGNLARNMEYLSAQQEKDAELRGKVKMAMIYPSVVLVLMFVMVMGLGIFVLPNLVSVLLALDAELPWTTKLLIAFSDFFSQHSVLAVSASIGAAVGFCFLNMWPPVKRVTQWCVFRIPGIGRLALEATIARFGVILGGMLRAGVPLVDALQSLADVTTILSYKAFYQRLTEDVKAGQSFRQSFEEIRGSTKLLPVSVQSLIVVGEQSGSLSEVLLKIADIYDKKASETAQKLPIILEPMLLLFIGGLVAFIAISIIVPIYSVVGQMGVPAA